ncbi:hypothetical protein B4U79_18557 [Dinothrombium tinctorium]|uniref:Beta-ketoacyl synthase-like N-terminal domain-containing protein n=1 Tax=Dinothrombium tinctorium TaxID=1965070 RepID=A0A3S3Q193_9ACAR|nr:hypothetical protein B4U79_18557 [Dinothrombium tinctorium]
MMSFSEDDIVVSGISGRFPNADNIEELWTLLLSGQNLASPETIWPSGELTIYIIDHVLISFNASHGF